MKRVILVLTVIISNVTLFSCTTSDIAEEIAIEELATEGDEGEINEEDKD